MSSFGKRLWEGASRLLTTGGGKPAVAFQGQLPAIFPESVLAPLVESREPEPVEVPTVEEAAVEAVAPSERLPVELRGPYKLEVASGNYIPTAIVVGTKLGETVDFLLLSESGHTLQGVPVDVGGVIEIEDQERVGSDGKPVVWRLTPLS